MKAQYLSFQQVPQFSKFDTAYTTEAPNLRDFYTHAVNINQFKEVIEAKQHFPKEKRTLLCKALTEQYKHFPSSKIVEKQIQQLNQENCFTVVTAHQPTLFTGPLYFIYKTISCIKLTQQLSEQYPEQCFVPIFWLGGEDHDFEEMNHCLIFNKKIEWTDRQGGSLGEYDTASLQELLTEVDEILGNGEQAQKIRQLIHQSYGNSKLNYGQATQYFVHLLFEQYGLIVMRSNSALLKASFVDIMRADITENTSKQLVQTTADELIARGYKAQAFPRAINLFFLEKGQRNRIERQGENFRILNRDVQFSRAELLDLLEEHPEYFSPNVILRPLYQESILPNLAYIGGGGELAYWLERKSQFEHFSVPFPMLIRRDSVLWIDRNNQKKIKKLGFSLHEIFLSKAELSKQYIRENADYDLNLMHEKEAIEELFDIIAERAEEIERNLSKVVFAHEAQIVKVMSKLEQKLEKAEKSKNELAIKQIENLKDKLFPQNNLQERKDNFLSYYARYGDQFIETLFSHLNPLNKKMTVIIEE